MTVEELKKELLGKEYAEPVTLEPHAIVVNAERFLHIQFIECNLWEQDMQKCPAYLRLMAFYKALKA